MRVYRPAGFVTRSGRRALLLAMGLGMALAVGLPASMLAHEGHGHPARIHDGTCEDLGPVAFRLTGVGSDVDLDNAPLATPTAINPDSAYQVMLSQTTIDGSIDDLLAAEHAVMVYESDEEMDAISCGNIGGAMLEDSLIVGLAEAGVPGHLGFAIFEPAGDQTNVSILLGHALAPVSASGAGPAHDHADAEADETNHDDEHAEEEEAGHDTMATPAA